MAVHPDKPPAQKERRALWYLKKISLLSELASPELAELASEVEMREVRRRRVIFLPGDPGTSVFFVSGGRVKISRVTRDGKELTLAYRVPGDIFGEICLVSGGPREEMAEAMENALVMEIPAQVFMQLLDAHASIGSRLTLAMLTRRRDLEAKVEDLIFKDVNAKLAELLLGMAQDYGVDDSRGTLLAVKITHQEMANLIGSTRETVSLTLSQFRRHGLIATEGRKIILASVEGLRSLA